MAAYRTYEEYETAVLQAQAKHRVNLADDWRKRMAGVWANGGYCPCRPGKVVCPCAPGMAEAQEPGGACACGLYEAPKAQ